MIEFEPNNPEVLANIYSYYKRLREESPVHYVPSFDQYVVTRHADIMTIVTDPATYSNERATDTPLAAIPMLPTADDPEHARQRRLLMRPFTPKAVKELEPFVEQAAQQLVDQFVNDGACDLISNFAYLLPITVVGHLCDLPPQDANFRTWSDAMFAAASDPTGAAYEGALEALMEFGEYIMRKANERKAILESGEEPPTDILTSLVKPGEEGETLSEEEFVIAAAQLLTAGHETTTKLIGNTTQLLLTHPEALAALKADASLIGSVIEESLRFESPAQGLWRRVVKETTLNGVTMPAESRVYIAFGAANRDPEVFTEPDTFNVQRSSRELRSHLAFGHGIHNCLGSSLARMQGRIAIRTFLDRLPNLQLDDTKEAARTPLHWMRGWEVLPVKWDV